MAYRVQAGNEVINASGSKVLDVSDNFDGDTPKLVQIKSTKSTSDGSYQDDAVFSFGWGDENQEDSAGLTSADNVGTSEVGRSIQDNLLTLFDPTGGKAIVGITAANPAVVTVTSHGYSNGDTIAFEGNDAFPDTKGEHVISNVTTHTFTIPVTVSIAGGTLGKVIKITDRISLTSFAADTVTLNVDIYGGTSYTMEYMALGGSTLTDVFVGSFNAPTTDGDFDITGLGFDDVDAVMMFTSQNDNGTSNPPSISANTREAAFSFGFFDVANGSQCAESHFYSDDNSATMDTLSVSGTDVRCWSHFSLKSGVWTVRGRFTFVSVIADGFRLNQPGGVTVPGGPYRINFVALKGGNYEVVQKTAPTSPGTQDIVNSGFTPSAAIFGFGDAGGGMAAMSMGWASNKDGTKVNTKQGVAFVSDDDGLATSETKRLTRLDKSFARAFAGASSDRNAAEIHTWNANGLTLDHTTALAAVTYHAIMFGDGTVTPPATGRRRVRPQVI